MDLLLGDYEDPPSTTKHLPFTGGYQPGKRYPTVLTFPIDNIVFPVTVKSPTLNGLFNLNLSFGNKKAPTAKTMFFKSIDLVKTVTLYHIAPIPAFLSSRTTSTTTSLY